MSLGSLLIYGAGGHGRVVADAAREAGWQLAAWGDGDPARDGQVIGGAPVRVTTPEAAARLARNQGYFVVVAIGDNGARRRVFLTLEELGLTFATIVHPRAVVAASAELGPGTVVFAGGVVNPDARLGKNVILNTAATVDHDGRIGDHAHLSPGAHLGGTVEVGEGTHVGIGAAVRDGIRIGAWTVVGAGASVVKDLPAGVMAYGVPARVVRARKGESQEV